jgi:anti-sigma B factor antagonist
VSDLPGPLELSLESVAVGDATVAIVRARGEIDLAVADEFEAAIASAPRDGAGVVLDLSGVPFVDSSGLRVLLVAVGELGDALCVVIDPAGHVARVLELAEATERVQSCASLDEALAALAGDGRPHA